MCHQDEAQWGCFHWLLDGRLRILWSEIESAVLMSQYRFLIECAVSFCLGLLHTNGN